MEVVLIRHGQTAANHQRRYAGRIDEPLSAEGKRQIGLLGVAAGVKQVYCSPLRRAVQSARLLFPRAELVTLPGLAEMDFGCFEGYTADELQGDAAYRAWVDSDCAAPCPGGEGMTDFCERVCAAFAQAVQSSLEQERSRLIVVAHGGSLMAIMSSWARPARPYFEWQVKNAGGYRAVLDQHTWQENPVLSGYAPLTVLNL